jgi:hypothetical protein
MSLSMTGQGAGIEELLTVFEKPIDVTLLRS